MGMTHHFTARTDTANLDQAKTLWPADQPAD